MPLDYVLIGKRIKETRHLQKITQAKLSELANLSASYICDIESAKKKASLCALVQIASVMNITMDTLLIGNQKNVQNQYQNDIVLLMGDCSDFEKRVIFETICAMKRSLRGNIYLCKQEKQY